MTRSAIPNFVTSLRMAGTLCLLFTRPLSPGFYLVYTFTGLTDALDGWLARRLKAQSTLGARLDSVADLLFYAVMLLKLFPLLWVRLPGDVWWAVGAALLLRLGSYAAAAIRFRRFAALHTWLNKLTGAAVFALPYALGLPIAAAYSRVVCAAALLSSGEELLLHLRAQEYDENTKTIFSRRTTHGL